MKNIVKQFEIIALVALIGFSMAACPTGGPTGGGGPQTVTYTGTKGGTYTLKITEKTARYTAQNGDAYVLTLGRQKENTGMVERVSGSELTLKSSDGTTLTATVSGSNLTKLEGGSIIWSDNSETFAPGDLTRGDEIGQPRTFWAVNMRDNEYYQVPATLLYIGTYCIVYAENDSGVTAATAKAMADAYERKIFPIMIDNFGERNIDFKGERFRDTMDFANNLTDRTDGKLTILLLDILDNYKPGVNMSFTGGYFDWVNFLPDNDEDNSNETDMIYIDTYPGKPASEESNRIVAHEMQHLMNFVSTIMYRFTDNNISTSVMDTWVNEGLSTSAEYVYGGAHTDRLDWYNYGPGLITQGNNFFVWNNRVGEGEGKNIYANLDDYATVYLFFQWLRLQSGGTAIYKKIITSSDRDYKAVTNAAKTIDASYSDWGTLLKTWLAANALGLSGASPYGYRGDAALNTMKTSYYAPAGGSISLYPGEGVYSKGTGGSSLSGAPTIKYATLMRSAVTDISDSYPANSGTLLTYNVSTMKTYSDDGKEIADATTGTTLAGVSSTPSFNMVSGSRAAPSGPFPVSAGEMLARNGHGDRLNTPGVQMPGKRLVNNE